VSAVVRFEFDRAYVTRLAAGDGETERHFTRYFGELLSIKLRSRLRSAALVEDAKQETFLRVLTVIRTRGLASAGSLGAFVNSVCNNILFEIYRAEFKQRQTASDEAPEVAEPGENVESALMGEEEQRQVRRAVEALPAKDQTLLQWVFFDERNKDDICRDLGIDRQYLRVLLYRARDRFREEFLKIGSVSGTAAH
jgi:RNA polymerase sigma-70 factor (ECF subfamily)